MNCVLAPGSFARSDSVIRIRAGQVVRALGKCTPEFYKKLAGRMISPIE